MLQSTSKFKTNYFFAILFFGLSLVTLGCQYFQKQQPEDVVITLEEKRDLGYAQTLFEEQKYEEAEKQYLLFIQNYPQSVYSDIAQLQLAATYKDQGKLSDCKQTLLPLIEHASKSESLMKIASEGYYQLSFCEEDAGKSIASLSTALKNREHLKESRKLAQIPARMASLYLQLFKPNDAQEFIEIADQGVKVLRKRGISNEELSHIYLEMGQFPIFIIADSEFEAHLRSFEVLQKYLIRSIELGNADALTRYQSVWNQFLTGMENTVNEDKLDFEALQKKNSRRRTEKAALLLEVVQQAKIYQEEATNPVFDQYVQFIDDLQTNLQERLIEPQELSLTKESQKYQRTKREGKVVSDPLFKNEQKSGKKKE